MSDSRSSQWSSRGHALAVVGASGGVGTTTLVAAVGAALVRAGWSCAVVDLQHGGGGLDVPYAVEHLPGVRWGDLADLDGPVDGAALLPRLPSADGVRVLAHARESGPVPDVASCAQVIDGLRAAVDSVVLDAPRNLPAALLGGVETAVLLSGTGVLELSALAAVGRRVADHVDRTIVVLRDRRESPALSAEVSRALELPVLGWLRDDPQVRRNLARGTGPASDGPLGQLARLVVRAAFPASSAVAS